MVARLLTLAGLDRAVPNATTLCRRQTARAAPPARHRPSHPNVADIRGAGLPAGVQMGDRRDPLAVFYTSATFGPRVTALARNNGLIVRAIGATIGMCPPLVMTEREIGILIDRASRAMDQAASELAA